MLSVSSRVAQTIDDSAGNRKQGPPWCPCPRPMGCEPGMTSVLALPGGRTIHLVKPVIFSTLLSISQLATVAPGEKQSQQPPSCRDLLPLSAAAHGPCGWFSFGVEGLGERQREEHRPGRRCCRIPGPSAAEGRRRAGQDSPGRGVRPCWDTLKGHGQDWPFSGDGEGLVGSRASFRFHWAF